MGRQADVYERVLAVQHDRPDLKRTAAFAVVAEEFGASTPTVATNFYRTARRLGDSAHVRFRPRQPAAQVLSAEEALDLEIDEKHRRWREAREAIDRLEQVMHELTERLGVLRRAQAELKGQQDDV